MAMMAITTSNSIKVKPAATTPRSASEWEHLVFILFEHDFFCFRSICRCQIIGRCFAISTASVTASQAYRPWKKE
jgi:hypothetical protein